MLAMINADLFHCKNIPDLVMESSRSQKGHKLCNVCGQRLQASTNKEHWWEITRYKQEYGSSSEKNWYSGLK